MRTSILALFLAAVLVVGGTALYTGARRGGDALLPGAGFGADAEGESPATFEDVPIVSFDGTVIMVTVFKPANASAERPVPLVLHSHGWGGERASSPGGIVGRLVEEGFGVVSVDARGHGESGGNATVHHEDYELKDTLAVLDHAAKLPWVMKEPGSGIPNDVVVGGTGYSYAGGFQLMAASHDGRLDAIAPEITWSDLNDALAPNGVVKSVWVHALIGMAKESGTRVDPRIERWYEEAMLFNRLPPDAEAHFRGSSPRLADVGADVLLIQGVPDVLFNLNQAVRTYRALEEAGMVDVRLWTHLTGHVLPTLQPFALSPERRATFDGEGPCGNLEDLVVAWLDEKLRGGPASGIPKVSFALEDGECLQLDALPATTREVKLAALPAPQMAGSVLAPLARGPLVIAGVPHLNASVTAPTGGIVSVGLVVVDARGMPRVVDDQSIGARLDLATLRMDLAGVATRLHEGDTLFLRVDGLNEWYATNGARLPGAAALTDVTVTLPVVQEAPPAASPGRA